MDGLEPSADATTRVHNGIAYRRRDGSVWVTGKLWPKMHRIEIAEMPDPPKSFPEGCKTKWNYPAGVKPKSKYPSSPSGGAC